MIQSDKGALIKTLQDDLIFYQYHIWNRIRVLYGFCTNKFQKERILFIKCNLMNICSEDLKFIRISVEAPEEFLLCESSNVRSSKSSSCDNLVPHHLQAVEDADGVGGELHPSVLLIPHVWQGGALLPQDPELSEGQSIH